MHQLNLTSANSVRVTEFECQVRSVEGFPIIIRQPSTLRLDAYPYQRAATASLRIGELLQNRITSIVAGAEVVCLKPDGTAAPRNMVIGTLRRLYAQQSKRFGTAV